MYNVFLSDVLRIKIKLERRGCSDSEKHASTLEALLTFAWKLGSPMGFVTLFAHSIEISEFRFSSQFEFRCEFGQKFTKRLRTVF